MVSTSMHADGLTRGLLIAYAVQYLECAVCVRVFFY